MNNCSFDTKTGIWNSESIKVDKENDIFRGTEKFLAQEEEVFKNEIELEKGTKLKVSLPINNSNWQQIYFNDENNFENFIYNNSNQIILKSKKLTRHQLNYFPIFYKRNVFVSDQKGNIIIYSIEQKKLLRSLIFIKEFKGQKNLIYMSIIILFMLLIIWVIYILSIIQIIK